MTKKLKAMAATWAADGALVVIADRDKKPVCVHVKDGNVLDEQPGLAGARRVAVLGSGAVLMLAENGKGRWLRDGVKKPAHVAGSVWGLRELTACHGVAYAGGHDRRLLSFDETAMRWRDCELAAATARYPVRPTSDLARSIVEGARGPIVCTSSWDDEHRKSSLCFELLDGAWRLRAKVNGDFEAACRDPVTDMLYLVGATVVAIEPSGSTREVVTPRNKLWGCAWLTKTRHGAILASAGGGAVCEVGVDGSIAEVRSSTGESLTHDHCLASRGDQAALVSAGAVHVFERGTWREQPLG